MAYAPGSHGSKTSQIQDDISCVLDKTARDMSTRSKFSSYLYRTSDAMWACKGAYRTALVLLCVLIVAMFIFTTFEWGAIIRFIAVVLIVILMVLVILGVPRDHWLYRLIGWLFRWSLIWVVLAVWTGFTLSVLMVRGKIPWVGGIPVVVILLITSGLLIGSTDQDWLIDNKQVTLKSWVKPLRAIPWLLTAIPLVAVGGVLTWYTGHQDAPDDKTNQYTVAVLFVIGILITASFAFLAKRSSAGKEVLETLNSTLDDLLADFNEETISDSSQFIRHVMSLDEAIGQGTYGRHVLLSPLLAGPVLRWVLLCKAQDIVDSAILGKAAERLEGLINNENLVKNLRIKTHLASLIRGNKDYTSLCVRYEFIEFLLYVRATILGDVSKDHSKSGQPGQAAVPRP